MTCSDEVDLADRSAMHIAANIKVTATANPGTDTTPRATLA